MKPDEPKIDPTLPTTLTPSGRVVYDPFQAERKPVKDEELKRLVEELHALENADARDAVPEPVTLHPAAGGALITEEGQDAAKAHVEAAVPEAGPAGHIDSAPVKVMDPRRAPTVRIEKKKSPWIADGEAAVAAAAAAAGAIDTGALPSATAAASAPPLPPTKDQRAAPERLRARSPAGAGRREGTGLATGAGAEPDAVDNASAKRGAVLVGAGVVALVVWLVFGGPLEPSSASGVGATSGSTTGATTSAAAPGPASATGAAPPPSGASTTSATATPSGASTSTSTETGATTAAPEATQLPAPSTTTSATGAGGTAPRTSGDPYADAGASPKPTATVQPTTAPAVTAAPTVMPSVPPAVSSAPSSKPSASSAPSNSDTIFVIKPKGSTSP